ncbi:hypothetical protein C8A03DRAFT_32434 [Achaetomium macrosporum]|uniref:Uncharacterized protein n=1 Tax=Achaetomium macrosporum TaxID=79813 RepID=A0AAN7CDY6_9PEZI|nr:hypothetical protein C8A03DRAFT_32434 [Achaetomium macrosporum]
MAACKHYQTVTYWVCCCCGGWNSFQVVQCINVSCQHAYNPKSPYCTCRIETVKKTAEPNPPPSS